MLRQVKIDKKPNGEPITIPVEVREANLEQQVKRFVEIADDNPFDGQLHISLFRRFHGGAWTLRILQHVIRELQQPQIDVNITHPRSDLLPFFDYQFERHQGLTDTDFGYPGDPGDRTRFPI